MHTAFFGLPNNSQVIRVRGGGSPTSFFNSNYLLHDVLSMGMSKIAALVLTKTNMSSLAYA